MSDISLDLSGVIALLVFMISAAAFGFAALISLLVALGYSVITPNGVSGSRAFAFFIAALPFVLLDLAGFAAMFYTADSNSHNTNSFLDIAACAWLILQPIIWMSAAVIFNKVRLK